METEAASAAAATKTAEAERAENGAENEEAEYVDAENDWAVESRERVEPHGPGEGLTKGERVSDAGGLGATDSDSEIGSKRADSNEDGVGITGLEPEKPLDRFGVPGPARKPRLRQSINIPKSNDGG